ncbi:teichoic acid transport system ATP-binding protein [Pseudobutyrivibrio ruminis]|uniref:Teichoic acid transport system ATP-binding protein n=1 Tax=Pseudobutyrivibrio ruminis TaxID=46206 RepID=A0A1H7F738_9FIRM|nr:ABC transporter ATP-binding protein [Pseudobutyrivibrio ruminis]SEK21818.1 teichoic acid transport system ATP-binding protein [Pseudobutyrivibrio ruminis]
MEEISIEVKDLCIDYRPLKNMPSIKNLFREKREKEKIVHAVKNVSFQVRRGEILGIIGKNGSGKSTMLRAMAGIFQPDNGYIDLKGNSISLMSIGVGFNQDISGRKNIILSGMLLGFSEQEMLEKTPGIIEFAEIGDFIDMPVRTYSSGMHSKLAFAITANLDTDIMLVDEVLSVGDERFKKKSSEKMKALITDKNRTVIMVSHEMSIMKELCDRVLWINDGEMKAIGDSQEVIEKYREFMNS